MTLSTTLIKQLKMRKYSKRQKTEELGKTKMQQKICWNLAYFLQLKPQYIDINEKEHKNPKKKSQK